MLKFRLLLTMIVIVALIWSGWWMLGASARTQAFEAWIKDRRADGWVADSSDLSVRGYPFRHDTRIRGFDIADPNSDWAWSAPDFEILSLAYDPTAFILSWPREQKVSSPDGTVTVSTSQMRGSVSFETDTDLALIAATIEIDDLGLISTSGWTGSALRGLIASRRAEPGTAPDIAHDVAVTLSDVVLPAPLKRQIDPAGVLDRRIESAKLDGTAAFDAPWDRHAVQGRKPALTALALRDVDITWGDLRLQARGRFTIDDDGFPDGEIDITARNWRKMLRTAAAAGLIPPELARAAEQALQLLALMSGDKTTLEVPLRFRNQKIAIGPVPIGPAPRFPKPQRQ